MTFDPILRQQLLPDSLPTLDLSPTGSDPPSPRNHDPLLPPESPLRSSRRSPRTAYDPLLPPSSPLRSPRRSPRSPSDPLLLPSNLEADCPLLLLPPPSSSSSSSSSSAFVRTSYKKLFRVKPPPSFSFGKKKQTNKQTLIGGKNGQTNGIKNGVTNGLTNGLTNEKANNVVERTKTGTSVKNGELDEARGKERPEVTPRTPLVEEARKCRSAASLSAAAAASAAAKASPIKSSASFVSHVPPEFLHIDFSKQTTSEICKQIKAKGAEGDDEGKGGKGEAARKKDVLFEMGGDSSGEKSSTSNSARPLANADKTKRKQKTKGERHSMFVEDSRSVSVAPSTSLPRLWPLESSSSPIGSSIDQSGGWMMSDKSGHLAVAKNGQGRRIFPEPFDLLELDKKLIKTTAEENRRRRNVIVKERKNGTLGFTLQTYGLRSKKKPGVITDYTYVDYVEISSPAFKAGMRAGDIILSVNGCLIESLPHVEVVSRIRSSTLPLRMVLLFEDCTRKVDLNLRHLKLQDLLRDKVFELRSLCVQERRILEGLTRFDTGADFAIDAVDDDEDALLSASFGISGLYDSDSLSSAPSVARAGSCSGNCHAACNAFCGIEQMDITDSGFVGDDEKRDDDDDEFDDERRKSNSVSSSSVDESVGSCDTGSGGTAAGSRSSLPAAARRESSSSSSSYRTARSAAPLDSSLRSNGDPQLRLLRDLDYLVFRRPTLTGDAVATAPQNDHGAVAKAELHRHDDAAVTSTPLSDAAGRPASGSPDLLSAFPAVTPRPFRHCGDFHRKRSGANGSLLGNDEEDDDETSVDLSIDFEKEHVRFRLDGSSVHLGSMGGSDAGTSLHLTSYDDLRFIDETFTSQDARRVASATNDAFDDEDLNCEADVTIDDVTDTLIDAEDDDDDGVLERTQDATIETLEAMDGDDEAVGGVGDGSPKTAGETSPVKKGDDDDNDEDALAKDLKRIIVSAIDPVENDFGRRRLIRELEAIINDVDAIVDRDEARHAHRATESVSSVKTEAAPISGTESIAPTQDRRVSPRFENRSTRERTSDRSPLIDYGDEDDDDPNEKGERDEVGGSIDNLNHSADSVDSVAWLLSRNSCAFTEEDMRDILGVEVRASPDRGSIHSAADRSKSLEHRERNSFVEIESVEISPNRSRPHFRSSISLQIGPNASSLTSLNKPEEDDAFGISRRSESNQTLNSNAQAETPCPRDETSDLLSIEREEANQPLERGLPKNGTNWENKSETLVFCSLENQDSTPTSLSATNPFAEDLKIDCLFRDAAIDEDTFPGKMMERKLETEATSGSANVDRGNELVRADCGFVAASIRRRSRGYERWGLVNAEDETTRL